MNLRSLILLMSALASTYALSQTLTLDQTLKIGVDNDGKGNGSFWRQHGDPSPPFTHAGHVTIPSGQAFLLTVDDGSTNHLGLKAPDDGTQVRLDFFTSSKSKGWVVANLLKPEAAPPEPKEPEDERPPEHKALSPAAAYAVHVGDLDFLALLLKKGLKVNQALDFENGNTLLHEAVSCGKLKIVTFLLKSGANPTIRDHSGYRPIDIAIRDENEALCSLLARPVVKDALVAGVPTGIIEALLPHTYTNDIVFVSWNKADPTPDLMAEIRKVLPNARTVSQMTVLEPRPSNAKSSYQDKTTKEMGALLEVTLTHKDETWNVIVRECTGPVMAGGGWKGKLHQKYGYWCIHDSQSWEE